MRTGGRLPVPVPALAPVLAVLLGLCSAERPAERQALVVPRRLGAAGGRERFRLEAFGERLTLELEPDSSFLAPDFTLQYLGGPPPPPEDDLSRCFYSGTVNRDPSSAAALSLCAGMRGAFSLRGRQYLIQPAPGTAHRRGAHLLRLRGARRAAPSARCAVAEAGAEAPEPEPAGHAGTVGARRRSPRGGEGGSASPGAHLRARPNGCTRPVLPPRPHPQGQRGGAPTWVRVRASPLHPAATRGGRVVQPRLPKFGGGSRLRRRGVHPRGVQILSIRGLWVRISLVSLTCAFPPSPSLFPLQKREAGGRRGSCPAPATWRPCW